MKRWNTIQQFGLEIAEIDKVSTKQRKDLLTKEFNIAQCTHAAKVITSLHAKHGHQKVIELLFHSIDTRKPTEKTNYHGFSYSEKLRLQIIVEDLFAHKWFPFSRIRTNMRRLNKISKFNFSK